MSRSLLSLALILGAVFLAGCGGSEKGLEAPNDPSGRSNSPDVASGSGTTSAINETRVITTSSLALETAAIRETYARVIQISRATGGYVADSSISGEGSKSSAELRLRVPATRHDDVIASLTSLDRVKTVRESLNAREVTEAFADLQSRLRNAERTEEQYRELMNQARTIDEVLRIRTPLDSVRGEIERLQGQLNLITDQTEFATINLSLISPSVSATNLPGPLEVFVGAWAASLVVAQVLLNIGAVLLVALIWVSGPMIVGYFGWRRYHRILTARSALK